MTLEVGTRVRFTSKNLGAVSKRAPGMKFVERQYHEGDTGTVELELPGDYGGVTWYAVTPDDDASVYVPVPASMFEVLT